MKLMESKDAEERRPNRGKYKATKMVVKLVFTMVKTTIFKREPIWRWSTMIPLCKNKSDI